MSKEITNNQIESVERKRIYLDLVIIGFLLLLLVTTTMAYLQTKSKGGQCIKGPFQYGAKELAKQGFPFNTQAYLLTERGLQPFVEQSVPASDVNLTQLEGWLK